MEPLGTSDEALPAVKVGEKSENHENRGASGGGAWRPNDVRSDASSTEALARERGEDSDRAPRADSRRSNHYGHYGPGGPPSGPASHAAKMAAVRAWKIPRRQQDGHITNLRGRERESYNTSGECIGSDGQPNSRGDRRSPSPDRRGDRSRRDRSRSRDRE